MCVAEQKVNKIVVKWLESKGAGKTNQVNVKHGNVSHRKIAACREA